MHIEICNTVEPGDVYFRISFKRGQTPSARIQEGGGGGAIKIQGEQLYIKDRESQLLRGGGETKAPPGPPLPPE